MKDIIPLITLGAVLNFGFVSLVVVRNLFATTKAGLSDLDEELTKKVSENFPADFILEVEGSSEKLAKKQERINCLNISFYPLLLHNLMHALIIIYSFTVLIAICFNKTDQYVTALFHIGVVMSFFMCLEIGRLVQVSRISDQGRINKIFSLKSINTPESSFLPLYYFSKGGLTLIFILAAVYIVGYFLLCEGSYLKPTVLNTQTLIVINLYLLIVAKVLLNLYYRANIYLIKMEVMS